MTDYLVIAGVVSLLPLLIWVGVLGRARKREILQANDLLATCMKEPGQLKACWLDDNDPITVSIQLSNGQAEPISGRHGVAAVYLFDELKRMAPDARFAVRQNGRELTDRELEKMHGILSST
ncbi:MAG: hypothetical protein M3O62_14445 [Pseudomonadota bacterium]|nr:hypothetical protein [Pseudomonadota bacterium]